MVDKKKKNKTKKMGIKPGLDPNELKFLYKKDKKNL